MFGVRVMYSTRSSVRVEGSSVRVPLSSEPQQGQQTLLPGGRTYKRTTDALIVYTWQHQQSASTVIASANNRGVCIDLFHFLISCLLSENQNPQ